MKTPIKVNRKTLAAGSFFVAVGLLYGTTALRTLPVGSALDMGPGYFPVALSGLLIVLGTINIGRGLLNGREGHLGAVPWRAIAMLMLAIVVFATLLRQLGMFPTTALTSAIACMSVRRMKPLTVLAVSLVIAIFCTLLFGYGVKLPIPIIGPLLGGEA
ncbi:MAG: tripartite tricarboxylate transporter TctB family protein [Alphaproteobacteria bacterium]